MGITEIMQKRTVLGRIRVITLRKECNGKKWYQTAVKGAPVLIQESFPRKKDALDYHREMVEHFRAMEAA